MANNMIPMQVVGTANLSNIYSEIGKLRSAIVAVNKEAAKLGQTNLNMAAVAQAEKSFLAQAAAIRGVRVETVQLADGAQHLSDRLIQGKRSMAEMFATFRAGSKNMATDIQMVADHQAKLYQSMVIPSAVRQGQAELLTNLGAVADRTTKARFELQAYNTEMRNMGNTIINWGKNAQWSGRQLTVGFTVPIAAAMAGITAMFMSVDKEMRRLQMVYGVGGGAGGMFSNMLPTQAELDNITRGVQQVSQQLAAMYGQSAATTAAVAADLAAAGYTQQQLLDLTKVASTAMVLGETDQQSAIKATIALQNTYRLSTAKTAEALSFFSAAQAATSTTMNDLIGAVPRVGPIIQNLGGTYKDTVALLTAMKEGGVAAGEGANALKNSLQRIIAPTKAAREEMKSFGIDLDKVAHAGGPVQMIEMLQQGLGKLDRVSRQVAISDLFGKFQAARITALLDNFNRTGTQSAKVMDMMSLSADQLGRIQKSQQDALMKSPSMQFAAALANLQTKLIPVAQGLLEVASKVVNAVSFVIDNIGKLGILKYIIGGLGLGAAIIGPMIMFGGLIANLVGQVFKLGQQFRMFKQGFAEGGGLASPFKALAAGIQATQNYLEEFNAAEFASEKAAKSMALSLDEQAQSWANLNKLLAEYRAELNEVLSATTKFKGMGGPGIAGGGGFVPVMPPSGPAGIIGSAAGPMNIPVPAANLTGGRGGMVMIDPVTGQQTYGEFSHMRPMSQSVGGSNILNIPNYSPQQNALGNLLTVPGYMTPQSGLGPYLNKLLDTSVKNIPVIPPAINNRETARQMLQELGVKQVTEELVTSIMQEFSLENIGRSEAGRMAMMRGLGQIQSNPQAMKEYAALGGGAASSEQISAFMARHLGPEQWQQIVDQASQDILNMYAMAQQDVALAVKEGRIAPASMTEQLAQVGGRFSEIVSEQYIQIVDGYEKALADKMRSNAKDATDFNEQMKRSQYAGPVNVGALATQAADTFAQAMVGLIQTAKTAMEAAAKAANQAQAQVANAAASLAPSNARIVIPRTPIIPSLPFSETIDYQHGYLSPVQSIARPPAPLNIHRIATGGKVYGPGGPKDDLIPAMLSNGEYVVKADAVGHYGTNFLDKLNSKKFAGGGIVRLFSGTENNKEEAHFVPPTENGQYLPLTIGVQGTAQRARQLSVGNLRDALSDPTALEKMIQSLRDDFGISEIRLRNIQQRVISRLQELVARRHSTTLISDEEFYNFMMSDSYIKRLYRELSNSKLDLKERPRASMKSLKSKGYSLNNDIYTHETLPSILRVPILNEDGTRSGHYRYREYVEGLNPEDMPYLGTSKGGEEETLRKILSSGSRHNAFRAWFLGYRSRWSNGGFISHFMRGGIARFSGEDGQSGMVGGYSAEALRGLYESVGKKMPEVPMTEAELQAYLSSGKSPFQVQAGDIDLFFASRAAGERGVASHLDIADGWDAMQAHGATAEETALADIMHQHATNNDKSGWGKVTPEQVDAGASRLREHLATKGQTMRLYRSLTLTGKNAAAAPGHFGIMDEFMDEASRGQRYMSFSVNMRVPQNFANPDLIGQTPRIIEVDVPIDAIVGINGMNYTTPFSEQEVLVDIEKIRGLPIRYVNPTGLAALGESTTEEGGGLTRRQVFPSRRVTTGAGDARFLETISPRSGAMVQHAVIQDIMSRLKRNVGAGNPAAVSFVTGYKESMNIPASSENPFDPETSKKREERHAPFYGVTSDEMAIVIRYLEDKYGKPIRQLGQKTVSGEDKRLLEFAKAHAGIIAPLGMMPKITEQPGLLSSLWSPELTTGRTDNAVNTKKLANGGIARLSGGSENNWGLALHPIPYDVDEGSRVVLRGPNGEVYTSDMKEFNDLWGKPGYKPESQLNIKKNGGSAPIVDLNERKIVMVDVGGQKIPFYLSSGLGGKKDVPAGRWYPFFGIGAEGWINKTHGSDIIDYYGSEELRKIAQDLDDRIGDIRDSTDIPKGYQSRSSYSSTAEFINQSMLHEPAASSEVTKNETERVYKNIDHIKEIVKGRPWRYSKDKKKFANGGIAKGGPISHFMRGGIAHFAGDQGSGFVEGIAGFKASDLAPGSRVAIGTELDSLFSILHYGYGNMDEAQAAGRNISSRNVRTGISAYLPTRTKFEQEQFGSDRPIYGYLSSTTGPSTMMYGGAELHVDPAWLERQGIRISTSAGDSLEQKTMSGHDVSVEQLGPQHKPGQKFTGWGSGTETSDAKKIYQELQIRASYLPPEAFSGVRIRLNAGDVMAGRALDHNPAHAPGSITSDDFRLETKSTIKEQMAAAVEALALREEAVRRGLPPIKVMYYSRIGGDFGRESAGQWIELESPRHAASIIRAEADALHQYSTGASAVDRAWIHEPQNLERELQQSRSRWGVEMQAARRMPVMAANGTYVSGPGGPRSDLIPAMISNGEYVVNADAVKHYGVGFMDSVNSKKLAGGGIARFVKGSGGDTVGRVGATVDLMAQFMPDILQVFMQPGVSFKDGIANLMDMLPGISQQFMYMKESARSSGQRLRDFGDRQVIRAGMVMEDIDSAGTKAALGLVDIVPRVRDAGKSVTGFFSGMKEKLFGKKDDTDHAANAESLRQKRLDLMRQKGMDVSSIEDQGDKDEAAQAERAHQRRLQAIQKLMDQNKVDAAQELAAKDAAIMAGLEDKGHLQRLRKIKKFHEQGLQEHADDLSKIDEKLRPKGGPEDIGKARRGLGKVREWAGEHQGAMGMLGFVASTGVAMAASKMSEKGPTAGSEALNYGAQAAQATAMFGPEVAVPATIAAAALGAALGDASAKLRDTTTEVNAIVDAHQKYRDSMSVSNDALSQLGLQMKSFSDVKFAGSLRATDALTQKINALSDAMANGSDQTKGMIEALKNSSAADQQKILRAQYMGVLQAGGNATDAAATAAAAGKAAGLSGFATQGFISGFQGDMKKYGGKGEISTAAGAFIEQMNQASKINLGQAAAGIGSAETQRLAVAGQKSAQGYASGDTAAMIEQGIGQGISSALTGGPIGQIIAGALPQNTDNQFVQGARSFMQGDWLQAAIKNVTEGRGVLDLKGSQEVRGIGEQSSVDWVKALNLKNVGPDFNINTLVSKRDDLTKQVTDNFMSGKDIFASGDKDLISAAKAAGLTESSTADQAATAMQRLNQQLQDLANDKNTQKAIQGYAEMQKDFQTQFIEPIENAMANLSPTEFQKSVGQMVSAVEKGGGSISDVVEKIATDMDPKGMEFEKIAKQFESSPEAAKNYLNALQMVRQMHFDSAAAAANYAKALAANPQLQKSAAAQVAAENALSTLENNLDTGQAVKDRLQANIKSIQDSEKKYQKDFQANQKAEQRAFQAKQERFQDEQKARQDQVKAIQKEMDARNKLYDAKQREMQQDQTMYDMQNAISKARGSGDLLALASAQNAYNNEIVKQNDAKAKQAADDADQAKIDKINATSDAAQTAFENDQRAFEKRQQAQQDAYDAQMEQWNTALEGLQAQLGDVDKNAAKYKNDVNAATEEIYANMQKHAGDSKYLWFNDPDNQKAIGTIKSDLHMTGDDVKASFGDLWTKVKGWNDAGGFKVDGQGQVSKIGVPNASVIIDQNGKLVWTVNGLDWKDVSGGASSGPGGAVSSSPNAIDHASGNNTGGRLSDRGGQTRATGGHIRGPGGPTSDSIPAMLSDGEYVVRASSVKQYGTGFMDAINAGRYATGGEVGGPAPSRGRSTKSTAPTTQSGGAQDNSGENVPDSMQQATGSIKSYSSALSYAMSQVGVQGWQGKCQSLARTIAGADVWAPSALDAWNSIPSANRHAGSPPPAGAIAYWGSKEPGHATWVIGKTSDGTTYVVSNDAPTKGTVGRVPWDWFKDNWGMNYNGWIDQTPSGKLPIGAAAPSQLTGLTPSNGSVTGAAAGAAQTSYSLPSEWTDSQREKILATFGFFGKQALTATKIDLGDAVITRSAGSPSSATSGADAASGPSTATGPAPAAGSGAKWLKQFIASKSVSDNVARTLFGLGMRESSGNSKTTYPSGSHDWNSETPHYDVGLWQVNSTHLGDIKKLYGGNMQTMFDPDKNFDYTKKLSNDFTNFQSGWGVNPDGSENWAGWPSTGWDKHASYKEFLAWRSQYDKYADGGHVRGPGTDRSDSIHAMLSNGEYVVRAGSVNKYGVNLLDAINSGTYSPKFSSPISRGGIKSAAEMTELASSINNVEYNINVNVAGTNASPDEIANAVMAKLKHRQSANMTHRSMG